MRIIGLCTVKNEGDIIYQCLSHSAEIYDVIFVTDNESWDNSRNEIQRASRDFQNVVYLGEVGDKVSKEVKWQIWETFRGCFSINDWWGILDADEFVEPDVRDVVARANVNFADHIFAVMANFYYTESEVEDWMQGCETMADRERPIQERRLYYRMHTTQPRLFRNLPWIRWNEDTNYPPNLARKAADYATYRHYQYRDVPQVKLRVETRSQPGVGEKEYEQNPHWDRTHWRESISPDDDPYLVKHEPGAPLKQCPTFDGIPPQFHWTKGVAKYLRAMVYGLTPQRKPALFQDLDAKSLVQEAMK